MIFDLKINYIKSVLAKSTNYNGKYTLLKLNDSLVINEDDYEYTTTGKHQFGGTVKPLVTKHPFPKFFKEIPNLEKEQIVDYYKNKNKEWKIEEIELFEAKIFEIYKNFPDFFEDNISGFNDGGYGKYSTMSDDLADWGLDDIYNNKRYSTHDIVDTVAAIETNPYVFSTENGTYIVDVNGLIEKFKKNINKTDFQEIKLDVFEKLNDSLAAFTDKEMKINNKTKNLSNQS